ncbi:hypothetical protein PVK06_025289 [Gossypium arboreum]|uniref:Uncharacterized protein n=1 Tax=Gossypium arboreum TaxID=29729 RepID=A0ABR0PGA3_GOSAR|nr:hypothetical protein PVK06_025289 [Gossypium arboreum]
MAMMIMKISLSSWHCHMKQTFKDMQSIQSLLDIIPGHMLMPDSKFKELCIGLQFLNQETCVAIIKYYNLKVSVDYKAIVSTLVLYIGECWRHMEGCKWWVRVALMKRSLLWEVRKYEGLHTCTVAQITYDN